MSNAQAERLAGLDRSSLRSAGSQSYLDRNFLSVAPAKTKHLSGDNAGR
jgi:hypothetical protein